MTHEEATQLKEHIKGEDSRIQAVVTEWRAGNYRLDLTLQRAEKGPLYKRVYQVDEGESVLEAWLEIDKEIDDATI